MNPRINLILFLTVISFFSCKKEEERIMKVRNDSISDISYTTAKATATIIDPGEGIEQHGHCWSTNTELITIDTENKTEKGGINATGSYFSDLTNLSPGTNYYVKAYLISGATVIYSNKVLPFTTLSMGKPVVTTGTISNIATIRATVSGTLNSLGAGASSVTDHGHCWSSETATPKIENDYINSKGSRVSIGSFESTIVGLLPGTLYYVRAYATNDAGTTYGDSISFRTREKLMAEFDASPKSGYFPLDVQFTDMSTGDINSWTWNFGDDETSTTQNPSHTYNVQGSYSVTLTVSNDNTSDSETKHDFIIVSTSGSEPVANFSADKTTIVEGETVSFTDQSVNVPTTWTWVFGDGGTSSSQHPSHQYNTSGTYDVTLVASNSYGSNSKTRTDYITVSVSGSAPVANFTADKTSITEGETVNFTDQSTNGPTSWSWIFGDGETSSSQNPSSQYNTKGTYSVTLTATNSYGSDSVTKNNYITVESEQSETVTDYDGNEYNTVQIGDQVWMAENLKTTKYSNGTDIPLVTDSTAWANLTTPAYCWYNNNSSYKDTYGALYNWYTVNTGNLCPTGWHVPSDAEWTTLTDYLGENVAGGKLKESGTTHWNSPNTNATNETGFTALPGGYRYGDGGFYRVGGYGYWWSATESGTILAWGRRMAYGYSGVDRDYVGKELGFSVRCVRD